MEEATLLELSQRDEAFWIGLVVLLSGLLVPETIHLGSIALATVLIGVGALVLSVRLLVGVGSILRTAVRAWRAGRARGRLGD